MNVKPGPKCLYAVLTGDVVGSTKLTPPRLDEARRVIREAVKSAKPSERASTRVSFFRGDAWQILLMNPSRGLRVALLIKAALWARLEIETRVSVGIGNIESHAGTDIAVQTGEAFTLSGRTLDRKPHFGLTGALPDTSGELSAWFVLVLQMCDAISSDWTRRQAEIVYKALSLSDPTHEQIAERLKPPVTQQTVSESLNGAGWRSLSHAIEVFEQTDWLKFAACRNAEKHKTAQKTCHQKNR